MAKIYAVATDYTGKTWAEAIGNTFKLDAAIQRLAKAEGESISLYSYKTPVSGQPPVVLLECSEAFLEKVKRLPLFNSVRPLGTAVETVNRRSAPQVESPEATKRNKGPKGP